MIPQAKLATGRKRTQHLNMTYLKALVANRGRSVFLEKPSIPGLAKQENTSGRQDPITGRIALKGQPNTARGGASMFHSVNRAQHIGTASGNHTRVQALDICPEAIKSPITGPILMSPQRSSTSGSQGNTGNQNLNLCHILMEDKVSKTGGAEFPKESRSASFQSIPDLGGSMLRQRQVNASNLKLGACFPNVRGLFRNLPKIAQGLVNADTDCFGGNLKLCPFAGIEAHSNVALTGIGGGGRRRNPSMGGTRDNNGRGRRRYQL